MTSTETAALKKAQKVNSTILACGGLNPIDWWEALIDAQQTIAAAIKQSALSDPAQFLATEDGEFNGNVREPVQELHGPFGYLNGCRSLSEDSWELESDPDLNNGELFSLPLFTLTDPFKRIGGNSIAKPAQDGWQDISTAPRDGTRFLAAGGGLEFVDIVKWYSRVGAWEATECHLEDWDDQSEGYSRPKVWQPLPSAPPIKGGE